MARSAEDIIKEQFGHLLFQLSITQSRLEEALEKNKVLVDEANKTKEASKPAKNLEEPKVSK